MEFSEINDTDRARWDVFVRERPECFLQAWDWGEFQRAAGRGVRRFAVCESDRLVAVAQIIEHRLPLGLRYWYVPRGPVLAAGLEEKQGLEILHFLLGHLRARARGCVFVRLDPAFEAEKDDLLRQMGLRSLSGSVQPRDTLLVDLRQSEEELLAAMKQKTRYNLRLSEKKGVEVAAYGFDEASFAEFWRLTGETAARDGITVHAEDYYRRMLATLAGSGLDCRLYLARCAGRTLAANLVLFFGGWAVYLHGASSSEQRQLMAPYLLQWRQMRDAKARGCRTYDFWGITLGNDNPKWAGITRFKRGFGGRERSYAGAYDLPVRRIWYDLYRRLRKGK